MKKNKLIKHGLQSKLSTRISLGIKDEEVRKYNCERTRKYKERLKYKTKTKRKNNIKYNECKKIKRLTKEDKILLDIKEMYG